MQVIQELMGQKVKEEHKDLKDSLVEMERKDLLKALEVLRGDLELKGLKVTALWGPRENRA